MSDDTSQLDIIRQRLDITRDPRYNTFKSCNHCRLATTCFAYVPDNECTIVAPVQVPQSDHDLDALTKQVIALQTKRILEANLIETVEGGGPTDTTDKQVQLLTELLKAHKASTKNSISIQAEGAGGVGVLASLFSSIGKPTGNATTTQSPESRAYSKRKEQESLDEAESRYTDATIIDVTPKK